LSAHHSQTAFAHRPAHRRPQRPQFIGSRFASTHRPPQSRNQSSHRAAHRPDVHTIPSSQTRPQAPQFAGSFAGRVSHPFSGLSSQSAAPRWQTTPHHPWAHAPLPFGGFAQSVLTRHIRTTGAVSLAASTATSAAASVGDVTASHRPARHVSSARQDAPQAPQWTGLRDVSTHAPRHRRSPSGSDDRVEIYGVRVEARLIVLQRYNDGVTYAHTHHRAGHRAVVGPKILIHTRREFRDDFFCHNVDMHGAGRGPRDRLSDLIRVVCDISYTLKCIEVPEESDDIPEWEGRFSGGSVRSAIRGVLKAAG
jgi:hypothetical protein